MKSTEDILMQRQTEAFVKADKAEIVLTRRDIAVSAAGGVVRSSPRNLPRQTFRVVPTTRLPAQAITHRLEGELPLTDYMLVGNVKVDIQPDDEFVYNTKHYKVVYVSPNRRYETLAGVLNRD